MPADDDEEEATDSADLPGTLEDVAGFYSCVTTGPPAFCGLAARVTNPVYNQIETTTGIPYKASLLRGGWITDILPPDPMHTLNGIIKALISAFLLNVKLYKKMNYNRALEFIDVQLRHPKWLDILTTSGDRLRRFGGSLDHLAGYTHMEIAHLYTKFIFTICRLETLLLLFPREQSICFQKGAVGLYILMTAISSPTLQWTSKNINWLHDKISDIGNNLHGAFEDLGEDCNLPKVHNLRHILEFVEALCRPRETDTPLFEHQHIQTKSLFKATNRRVNSASTGITLESVMMRRAMVRQTLEAAVERIKAMRDSFAAEDSTEAGEK